MYLYINTGSDRSKISLLNENLQTISEQSLTEPRQQSEELLAAIDNLLKINHVPKNVLKGILVFRGPGSYTGLRVGIATANALSLAFNIKVWPVDNSVALDKKLLLNNNGGAPVAPYYLKSPHITQPK
ncbi:MAG: tRNA threonylcarbamoyladenosine biosynthesis protein TsaB [bacterium ADurb.Bin212]|nr:MAG: tRNA threonylcarbamoyladenosine biosynthesis protein TsaB [bacterium ADurb.Bin212]